MFTPPLSDGSTVDVGKNASSLTNLTSLLALMRSPCCVISGRAAIFVHDYDCLASLRKPCSKIPILRRIEIGESH
jgi:hypothetical protein